MRNLRGGVVEVLQMVSACILFLCVIPEKNETSRDLVGNGVLYMSGSSCREKKTKCAGDEKQCRVKIESLLGNATLWEINIFLFNIFYMKSMAPSILLLVILCIFN